MKSIKFGTKWVYSQSESMNHTSQWMKFFDERASRYHYKHKGLVVVRNTLMAIRKVFTRGTL